MDKNEENLNGLVEQLHKELYDIKNSIEYKVGKKITNSVFFELIYRFKRKFINQKLPEMENIGKRDIDKNNYSELENKKIVIYTCITGNYDNVIEPLYCNEKIDYILFTNNKNIKSDKWKIVYLENINNYDNVLLNRYVKMHPHKLLANYDYSIYIDGNIKIFSDLSSFINKIDKSIGLALSKHSTRDNLIDELETCKILKKGNIEKISKIIQRYQKEGMPVDYGMLEAPIIATEVHNLVAQKILEYWWDEFSNSEAYRDQIMLPYVLWKLKIKTCRVGVLSNNIWLNPKIEKVKHNK